MKKTICKVALLLGISVMIFGTSIVGRAQMKTETIERVQQKQRDVLRDIERENSKRVNNALEFCERDGRKSAKQLNRIKDNKHDFELGVREVLNEYYSMDRAEREELGNFSDTLDESAQVILEHYQEAELERENRENLDYEAEEVLVAFPYGTSVEKIDEIVSETALDYDIIDSGEISVDEELPDYKKERLKKVENMKSDMVILAKIGLEDTVERAKEKFEEYDCVLSASENSYLDAEGTVETSSGKVKLNDPKFNENTQWHMKNIDIPRAWKKFEGRDPDTEIWVAVIDCGVQMSHPDLKEALLTKYSVDMTQSRKKLIDCEDKRSDKGQYTGGHGTMVAGMIAAKSNNGKLGAGVASLSVDDSLANPCKIMAIKCDDSIKTPKHITKAYLAGGINYAVSHGAEVINISYSASKSEFSATEFSAVKSAIQRAIDADVCVVAGAGNDGSQEVRYPAGFAGVIGVGATLPNNTITSYSNQSSAVDIVAPGGEDGVKKIFSTAPTTMYEKGYRYGRGTSYATPQVSGTVAMMLSINYELTPKQIQSQLRRCSTVTVKGTLNKKKEFKLLNAGKAVDLTKEP